MNDISRSNSTGIGPVLTKFSSIGECTPSEPAKKPPGTYVCLECGDAHITFRTAVDEYKVKCPKCGTTMVRKPTPLT